MSETGGPSPSTGARRPGPEVRELRPHSGRVIAVLVVLAVVLGLVVGRSGLVRWWAGKVGDACDGQVSVAVPLGLGMGLVCAAGVVLAVREVLRRTRAWTPSFAAAIAALLLALPVASTLMIVIGRSAAAQAASDSLAEDAPGFATSLVVGAVVGAVLAGGFLALLRSRRRMRTEIIDLRHRLVVLESVATHEHGEVKDVPEKQHGDALVPTPVGDQGNQRDQGIRRTEVSTSGPTPSRPARQDPPAPQDQPAPQDRPAPHDPPRSFENGADPHPDRRD